MYLNSKEAWVKAEPTKYQKISRAPKKLDSGEFQKPRGRPPKGMSWDAKVGEWKNDGGEDEDEDEEDGAEEDEHQEDADDEVKTAQAEHRFRTYMRKDGKKQFHFCTRDSDDEEICTGDQQT